MTNRLDVHQPTSIPELTEEGQKIDKQRVYDLLIAQGNISVLFDELADKLHLDSFLIQDITLSASKTNLVKHKLGRAIIGWQIVDKNASSNIWRDTASTESLKNYLPLKCSSDVIISLIVF